MTTLSVEYRQDPETSGWTVTMPAVPAVVTQGRTLEEAHRRVRAALALVRGDADEVKLEGQTVWASQANLSREALEAIKAEGDLRVQSLDIEAELDRVSAQAAHNHDRQRS